MFIGELARSAACSTRAIRYYEQQGLLAPERAANGYRTYGPGAALRVRNIRKLLAIGLTSEDIKAILPVIDAELPDTFDASADCAGGRDVAVSRLTALEANIAVQQRLRDQLAARLAVTH
jgi:DNA-binding transcriptional MerR regulator